MDTAVFFFFCITFVHFIQVHNKKTNLLIDSCRCERLQHSKQNLLFLFLFFINQYNVVCGPSRGLTRDWYGCNGNRRIFTFRFQRKNFNAPLLSFRQSDEIYHLFLFFWFLFCFVSFSLSFSFGLFLPACFVARQIFTRADTTFRVCRT